MKKEDLQIGLVFSGGGSRGSYQIGVWRALMDMGLHRHVRAVYGTSVGAINGAAFVQDDLQFALDVWQQLDYTSVFADLPSDRPSLSNRKRYLTWVKGAIRNRGLDVSPLKEIIRGSINEQLIRASPVEYGLVVYDLTNRRPRYLTKEDIASGKLVEYIIASATFPIFQPHRIEDRSYIDGGVYDNRPLGFFRGNDPVDMAIVVDVTMARHIWPNKGAKGDLDIHYVRPSRLLGSPLSFKRDRIMSNLELGYQDAQKQLAQLSISR